MKGKSRTPFFFFLAVFLSLAILPLQPIAAVTASPLPAAPFATLSLVEDINPGAAQTSTAGVAQVGDTLFFSLNDGTHGYELWKSDGTAPGTDIVLDIQAGSDSGFPNNLIALNDRGFFQADDGTNGTEPWVSDGTPGGTFMIADLNPGSGGNGLYQPAALGTDILFAGSDAGNAPPDVGQELFKTSSPYTSASLVKNINDEGDGTSGSEPSYFTTLNGFVYFAARGPNGTTPASEAGKELWKTDGTTGNTVLFKDINPALYTDSELQGFLPANGLLFFRANDGATGYELWKSDGSPAGTQLVKDIFPGDDGNIPLDPNDSYAQPQIAFSGKLYFIATDGANGFELWRTDGTQSGTVMVKDINPGAASAFPNTDPVCFQVIKNQCYYSAQLWF